jgi:hypothetical protein
MVGSMANVMSRPAREAVSLDSDSPLAHILEACEMNGIPFMKAFDAARESRGTVGDLLDHLGLDRDAVRTDLKTLQQRDKAKAKLLDSGPFDSSQRSGPADSAGRSDRRDVGASSLGPDDPNVACTPARYEEIMNAPLHSADYAQAKQLADGLYNSPEGASRFLADSQEAAKAGVDMLKTMLAARKRAGAAQRTAQAVRRLDQAVAKGADAKSRRRELDSAIAASKRILDTPAGGKGKKGLSKRARAALKRVALQQPPDLASALQLLEDDQVAMGANATDHMSAFFYLLDQG